MRHDRPGNPGGHPADLAENEHKAPIKLSGKTLASVFAGALGVLLLGVGMCMVMVFEQMILGIVVGLVGIVALLMLIPLLKGVHD